MRSSLLCFAVFLSVGLTACLPGAAEAGKITNQQALLWVREICRQNYLPLGEKAKGVCVFIEISTSKEPWVFSEPVMPIEMEILRDMSTANVCFFREQDFEREMEKLDRESHVLRATFFPFASSYTVGGDAVTIPVWNGDVMKWRQNLFKLRRDGIATWAVIGIDYPSEAK